MVAKELQTLPEQVSEIDNRVAFIDGRLEELEKDVTRIGDALTEERNPGAGKLYGALAKAQAEFQSAELDASNPHFGSQYASIASILKAVRPALSKNELCLIQLPGRKVEGEIELLTLTTILGHSSGESIENYFEMYPPKRDPQGIGSAMTYMRRYAAMSVLGIAGAHDDDAEGAKASKPVLSPEQVDAIFTLADELFGDDAENTLERMCKKIFDVEAVAHIPEAGFEAAQNSLKNQRKRLDGAKAKPTPKQSA